MIAPMPDDDWRRAWTFCAGSDVYFRAGDWPGTVPMHRVLHYLKRFRDFYASEPTSASN
jgi:hypothetical protein